MAVYEGKIEGLWRLFPKMYAICDIASTGSTREANSIEWFASIFTAQLVLYESEDMSWIDRARVNDLKEQLLTAAQK